MGCAVDSVGKKGKFDGTANQPRIASVILYNNINRKAGAEMEWLMTNDLVLPTVSTTDEALLRAWRQGDETAFAELLRRHEQAILSYLTHASGDPFLSRDLCQECFLRLIHRPPRFFLGGRLKPWLFRVARNLLHDHWRRRKSEILAEAEAPDFSCPAEVLRNAEDRESLQRWIGRLSPELREVVELRVYGGLGFREIAEATSTPLGTALWRMQRALRELRGHFEKESAR